MKQYIRTGERTYSNDYLSNVIKSPIPNLQSQNLNTEWVGFSLHIIDDLVTDFNLYMFFNETMPNMPAKFLFTQFGESIFDLCKLIDNRRNNKVSLLHILNSIEQNIIDEVLKNGFKKFIDFDKISATGIRDVTKIDMDYAKKLGYRFKMIAQAKEINDGIGIDVAATLVSKKELVANVMDAYNVVEIDNDYVENVIYYGKGAGRYVTASAVVSDIIKTSQIERWSHDYEDCTNIYPITKSKYYLRASKPLDVDYEMYFTEKRDHIYITHEIELADLTTVLNDEEYTIFKVRG